MSGENNELLRNAMFQLLDRHPEIEPFRSSVAGAKGTRLRRYLSKSGNPVGHEHSLKSHQNLWVRRDDVRWNRLKDIDVALKTANELAGESGANSNLFAVPEFQNADLLRFKIVNISQAARIIAEVTS